MCLQLKRSLHQELTLEQAASCRNSIGTCKYLGFKYSLGEIDRFGGVSFFARTGCYDVIRHLHLRSNYTTVWVSTDNVVIDGHKSAMMWAGHSEHRLFVEALLKPGGIDKLPRGPKTGAKKGVRKTTPKKSARLKKMLQAPEMQKGHDVAQASADDVESFVGDVSSLLPGSLADPSQRPIVEAAGQDTEDLCVASTSKGHRCKRRRQHGCFCTHHYEATASQKFMLQLYEQVREPAQDAMASWEKALMDIAVQRSLEESQELQERLARSNALLDARVARLGLRRIATEPYGDCQFLAIIHSAQLPLSAQQLRHRIVQYLKPLLDGSVTEWKTSSEGGMQHGVPTWRSLTFGEMS